MRKTKDEKAGIPLRVRHVLVPGYTFDEEKLFHLGQTIGRFRNLKECVRNLAIFYVGWGCRLVACHVVLGH